MVGKRELLALEALFGAAPLCEPKWQKNIAYSEIQRFDMLKPKGKLFPGGTLFTGPGGFDNKEKCVADVTF